MSRAADTAASYKSIRGSLGKEIVWNWNDIKRCFAPLIREACPLLGKNWAILHRESAV